jgi:hypothetical protein
MGGISRMALVAVEAGVLDDPSRVDLETAVERVGKKTVVAGIADQFLVCTP